MTPARSFPRLTLGCRLIAAPFSLDAGCGARSVPVMRIYKNIINDRGSKYAVSGADVRNRKEVADLIKSLKKDKKFAKATHNTWAVIFEDEGPVKNDDGEGGAGQVILQMLEGNNIRNHVIIVTRWFGGVKLGGDRFRRVQDYVRYYLEAEKL